MDGITIEQIAAAVTWRLRQTVLYPQGSLKDVMIAADFDAYHFGAYHDNRLIAVLSLFPEDESMQLRKFAVHADFQRRGVGKQLLAHALAFAAEWGAKALWCHARTTATTFYENAGMRSSGLPFDRQGMAYVRMEKAWS